MATKLTEKAEIDYNNIRYDLKKILFTHSRTQQKLIVQKLIKYLQNIIK
jgi:hypothetical protein